MKSRYLLPLLAGLACLGCKKEVDPTTAMFNQIMGEYRFTSVTQYSYSNATGSTVSTTSVSACDIPIVASRDANYPSAVSLQIGGANPGSTGARQNSLPPSTFYNFSENGGNRSIYIGFEIGTGNIVYETASLGSGGGGRTTYTGKKL